MIQNEEWYIFVSFLLNASMKNSPSVFALRKFLISGIVIVAACLFCSILYVLWASGAVAF